MIEIKTVYGSKESAKNIIVGKDTVYIHTDVKAFTNKHGIEQYQYHECQYSKDEFLEVLWNELQELKGKVKA